MASNDKKLSALDNIALLVGRILIAVLFLVAAYNKFKGLGNTTNYFTKLGFPAPSAVAPLVASAELAMGALVLAGFKTRCVALAIAIFCVAAALIAHMDFGNAGQLNNFIKNLAIAGGALALFVAGAGAYSVDARKK